MTVIDRAGPAAGASSSGEGNLLVSDKLPGPELTLALRGIDLWRQLGERAGQSFEFEKKGGVIVAHDDAALQDLWSLALSQRQQGAIVDLVAGEELRQLEPALSQDLPGGVVYEQDSQVQPMLAVAWHVSEIVQHGGRVVAGVDVLGAERDSGGAISALVTTAGKVGIRRWVVNAAGPWAGEVANRVGSTIPVEPRRGHVLVTEPLPPLVRRKVFEASYIGSIHQSDAARACSSVVEATASGTMLLGSSRESVGFSHELNAEIVAAIAQRAVSLVPGLAYARLMRAYIGFRPATPDRLPIIGADPRVGRLLHATGHEGAGVGLAEVTAELVESVVLGQTPALDITAFAPDRFSVEATTGARAGATPPPRVVASPVAGSEERSETTPSPEPRNKAVSSSISPAQQVKRPRPPSGQPICFRFDGRDLTAPAATTIAGALLSNGERTWRTTRSGDQRRGLFCGIGTCFDCLVDVNAEKAVRACVRELREGDELRSSFSRGAGGSADRGQDLPKEQPEGQPEDGDHRGSAVVDVVVVGAGPAGMAAAATAAARGAHVMLVDAGPRLGGQFFRQPLVDNSPDPAPAGPGLPARFQDVAVNPRVELMLGRNVWSASREASGFVLQLDGGSVPSVRARALVLATGASELALPFPGWELPGVVTAGAAQALLKSQHLAIGRRVVVAGTGPFLLPVAAALAKAGARVTAVDAAPMRTGPRALPALFAHPAKLAEAVGYGGVLASHRVRFFTGRAVIRCEGNGRVEGAVVARLGPGWATVVGSDQTVEADAVCVSYGFVPRLELARQLGVSDVYGTGHLAAGVPHDTEMGTSTPGLFVAGELAGVAGAEVSELEGEAAGHAAASFIGLPDEGSSPDRERRFHRLRKSRVFASRLEALYPIRTGWTGWLDPSTVFCRCEQTTWGAVQAAVAQGATTARDVRGLTRCGMGYCQGRTCGPALQLAISTLTGRPLDRIGDLQKRPVAVPIYLGKVATSSEDPP